jgi:hypothetical protein
MRHITVTVPHCDSGTDVRNRRMPGRAFVAKTIRAICLSVLLYCLYGQSGLAQNVVTDGRDHSTCDQQSECPEASKESTYDTLIFAYSGG